MALGLSSVVGEEYMLCVGSHVSFCSCACTLNVLRLNILLEEYVLLG